MTSQWFGDYEIVKQLRVGGMATLYLARRHGAAGFSRLVALKMIHPHLAEQPSFIEMFVDEARICSCITHPNVVHVEGFGELDGVHYLVMEYLDGCSASELLQVFRRERRLLDPELAARVIMQVAGGLHAAHETRGPDGQLLELIHRDISPSNVLISVDGNAKLIDFGIARARNRVSETQAGITLKGKYRYVAPEQAQHAVVDRRCDIFSLGIVFWELLVGRPLFSDDSHLGLLSRMYQTEVPAPSTVNPEVPAAFDPIVLAMLQHDPANRPQTAAEVQRRIASAIPGAANREASELGAFAVEVRDRCAERRARRASADSAGPTSSAGSVGSDSHSFSPSPSPRPRMSSAFRIEVEPTGGSGVQETPLPVPSRWWRRRGVQLGAGLLGAGLILGIVLGRRSSDADARARGVPRFARELEQIVPHAPVTREAPPAPAVLPPAPAVAAPPASAVAPLAVAPPSVAVALPPPATALPSPTNAPPSPTPPAPPSPLHAPAPAEASTAPLHDPAAASPATARRDVARVVAKPRPKPARPAAGEGEGARPAPAPRAPKVSGARSPFTTEQFDDASNTSGAPAAGETVKGKKAPIAPDFDN